MLVFVEEGKPENPEKKPQSRDKNQQQTQPTYDINTENRTHATLPLYHPCSPILSLLCSSRKNPHPPIGRSLEVPRGTGVLKAKVLEAKYEPSKLEFPGGRGGAKQKTFCGGSMDIFWNCTFFGLVVG